MGLSSQCFQVVLIHARVSAAIGVESLPTINSCRRVMGKVGLNKLLWGFRLQPMSILQLRLQIRIGASAATHVGAVMARTCDEGMTERVGSTSLYGFECNFDGNMCRRSDSASSCDFAGTVQFS